VKHSFWHDKWDRGIIGFHQDAVNPSLMAYIGRLSLESGARIFLPLCGKTRDIGWLLAQGYRVCGAELSELAVGELFDELGVVPERVAQGALTRWSAPGLDIFVGDILDLDHGTLGPVDAIYDRAALVALPEGMRARYAAHLGAMTGYAPHLLICCVYDQTAMAGPPFSVDAEQVRAFYAEDYGLTLLSHKAMPGGMKGRCAADHCVWLLKRETTE